MFVSRFQEHVNTNPLEDVLVLEDLLKLKAEVGATPPGFETEPVVTGPPSGEFPQRTAANRPSVPYNFILFSFLQSLNATETKSVGFTGCIIRTVWK
jgi:hypothetical protein